MEQNSSKEKTALHSEIHIGEIIRPYIKKWYWFIIGAVVSLVIANLYLKTISPTYQVISTVLIKDSKPSGGGGDFEALRDLTGIGRMTSNGVDNEMEILKSKKLMGTVVEQLGVETDIFKPGRFRSTELYGRTSPIIVKVVNEKANHPTFPINLKIEGDRLILSSEGHSTISTTYNKLISLPNSNIIIVKNPNYEIPKSGIDKDFILHVGSREAKTADYQGAITVSLVNKDATVIQIAMNYSNVDKAKKIVDKLVDVYNTDAIKDKNAESKETAKFIEERIAKVGNELGNVEGTKEQFKKANQITDIETEVKLDLASSAEARGKQVEIESQLELTNSLINFVSRQGNYQVIPNNVGLDNPGAVATISTYNQLVLERSRLLENATPQNPVVQDVTKQINALRPTILQNLNNNRNGLSLAKSNYLSEQNKLAGKISKIPSQERAFREIEREQQIKETLYLLLLQKREETQIALAASSPKARIIDNAFQGKQVAPKPLTIFAISLLVGLLIPFLGVYLYELFNTKIKSKHDLEKLSGGKPIIGEIPQLERGQEEVIKVNDLSPMAEAFRILITNMNYLLPKKKDHKVIMVTSTVKGEGKTFVAVNLALTIASPTKKTVIVGADIRNPQLQRYNTSRKGVIGLTEFLYDDTLHINDIVLNSSFNPNLDVIYSGSIPPNPTELLSDGRFDVLIEELSQKYNNIIIDTAPLMLVTDTLLISDCADVTIYVTRSKYTDKSLIEFASKQIDSGKVKNAAFVINGVDKDYFGYGNKYGYGYTAEEKSFFKKFFKI